MRDLDAVNHAIVRPDTFAAYGFVLPLFSAGFAWVLAWHVSPHLATFSGWLAVCSLVSLPIPRLLRWDWRTYHFGVGFLQFGSLALIHLIPLLSVTLFGRLPPTFAGMFFLVEIAFIVWWCRRFFVFYRRVFADPKLWKLVYVEEADVIYYLQNVDSWLMQEKFQFRQTPTLYMSAIPVTIALLTIPFIDPLTGFVGVPFFHVFLAVAGVPISLLCLGLAVRGFLIFYYFPWKLKRVTGKNVYVDMATGPDEAAIQNNSA